MDESERLVDGVQVHSIGGMRSHTLGLRLGDRLRRFRETARRARQLQADVYHLHDPELIPLGLWLKASTQAAVVFDCHENNTAYIEQKHYLHPLLRQLLAAGMSTLERLAGHFFDAIVTADAGVADLYRRRYRARHVVVLHNFPRLDLFQPAEANGRNGQKDFDLVYHGTIPRYHLEIAFAVADELQRRGVRARWYFFGKCPEAEWAQEEISRRGLQDSFQIEARLVPHTEVASRVERARIGFIPLPDLPKFQHNIPTKLFEFMSLGMPTVLSDLPPSRPFVGDGRCALMVRADDPAAYADAIEALLQSPERARQMGDVGRRRARDAYNWEVESRKLLQLCESLAADRP
jgi:glycosyltransferase involved in cell wall biosynthesis